MISGQLPEENCLPVRVGVSAKVRVIFRVGGQPNNCPRGKLTPPVRVRVWLRVSFGVGGQFSSGTIFLEPLPVRKFILFFLYHVLNKYTYTSKQLLT